MHVRDFTAEMEALAPPSLAEEFDTGRIGLIVEGEPEIHTVCCALDATPRVVRAALGAKADMLVVHHTPIWTPLTALVGPTASLMRDILAGHLNVLLGLSGCRPLSLGLVGTCTLTLDEIAARLGAPLRVWGECGAVKQLAVVAGSGFDPAILAEARDLGADAFLSAELKHSVARAAPLPCLESTHYALEAPAMKRLAAQKGWQYIDDPPHVRIIP